MTIHRPLVLAMIITAPLRGQSVRAPGIEQEELVMRLSRSLDSLARAGRFAGAVALQRNGAVVFARAYGQADREAGRPNTLETAFNIGSINKVFTATAIRQLAAAGRLSLDSTLGTYWPDYPNAAARTATIRQLMEHQAGLGGNIFDAPPGGSRHDVRHNNDYLMLFANEPLAFPPGTSRRYCNACYVVLGMLVERLSGEDYYAYVARHIYEPAGMKHTAAFEVDSLPAGAAIGYTRDVNGMWSADAPLHRNTELLPGRGSAAGGGYSTVGDLLLFLTALRARAIPGGPPAGIGVAGGAPGLNAAVEGELPGGYDLAAEANLDPPAAEHIAQLVRGWLGVPQEDGPGRP